jgi:putative transposase
MTRRLSFFIFRLFSIIVGLLGESFRFGQTLFRPRASLVAENLFLRKQLAFYQERNVRPLRLTDSARLSLLLWSRWFDWRNALVVVKPETVIGWHRRAFQLFWRWKCRGLGGRPRLPEQLRVLIAEMARENPNWGEARVASELALKLGIRVSPRTVRAYWPKDLSPNRGPCPYRWMSFVRNHAKAVVACDFVVAVTLLFRILICIRGDGGGNSRAPSRQRNAAPYFIMDPAAAP